MGVATLPINTPTANANKMNPFLIVAVFAASCIVATVEAHACLLIPAQRGDIPDAIYKYAGK